MQVPETTFAANSGKCEQHSSVERTSTVPHFNFSERTRPRPPSNRLTTKRARGARSKAQSRFGLIRNFLFDFQDWKGRLAACFVTGADSYHDGNSGTCFASCESAQAPPEQDAPSPSLPGPNRKTWEKSELRPTNASVWRSRTAFFLGLVTKRGHIRTAIY